ncbi:hypothetical protein BDZ89DRAFT_1149072 [Hymenopellis radicata]|nr:hypothetical protein BDZ89DRAFT_1149072 [Hymenopellis radicata]
MSEGLFDAVDPAVHIPSGIVQMRIWTANNSKAYGILYLMLNQDVQKKVNNAGVGRSGRLLWAQLAAFYTHSDAATRSLLISKLNGLMHNINHPADTFLQAVIGIERNLEDIAIALPPFMIQGKIMNSLSSVYSPITTVLQNEKVMCSGGGHPPDHFATAVLDIPNYIDIDNMDPDVREGWLASPNIASMGSNISSPVFASISNTGYHTPIHPTFITTIATSASSAPEIPSKKKKKKKKKRKSEPGIETALDSLHLKSTHD